MVAAWRWLSEEVAMCALWLYCAVALNGLLYASFYPC